MKFRSVAFKLFLFAAFTGTVTVLLAANIGNFALFKSRYPIAAVFDDVTGLLKGDPVTLAGVTVGKVTGQRVEKGLALVNLEIDESVRLPKATKVEVRYRNLIGLRVVDLDVGDGSPPYLARKGGLIPLEQTDGPLDLDAVFNNLRPLLTGFNASDLNTLTEAFLLSFANHKDDIDAVLSDTATFFGALAGKGAELGSLVENMASVASAAADERENLELLLSNMAGLVESLAGNSSELSRTLTNLNIVTGDLGRLIANNRGSLERDLDDIVTVLNLVLRHQGDLKQIVNHLDDQLRATLKAMSYGEWANLYVYALCLTAESEDCKNDGMASAVAPAPTGVGALYANATRAKP